MVYGAMDRRNHKFYTYLSKVFDAIHNEQKNYNWLITDCECYPQNKELENLFGQEYCWLSGEELSNIIEQEDFQWIWAVLCGFEKEISLEEVLKYPLPSRDYNRYYENPVAFQHPLSSIEIVPCDSSWTLIISKRIDIIEHYLSAYPNTESLLPLNEKSFL